MAETSCYSQKKNFEKTKNFQREPDHVAVLTVATHSPSSGGQWYLLFNRLMVGIFSLDRKRDPAARVFVVVFDFCFGSAMGFSSMATQLFLIDRRLRENRAGSLLIGWNDNDQSARPRKTRRTFPKPNSVILALVEPERDKKVRPLKTKIQNSVRQNPVRGEGVRTVGSWEREPAAKDSPTPLPSCFFFVVFFWVLPSFCLPFFFSFSLGWVISVHLPSALACLISAGPPFHYRLRGTSFSFSHLYRVILPSFFLLLRWLGLSTHSELLVKDSLYPVQLNLMILPSLTGFLIGYREFFVE